MSVDMGEARLPVLPRGDVLGIRVTMASADDVLRAGSLAVNRRRTLVVSFVNPNYVMAAGRNAELRAQMNSFDVLLSDGWGVVWGGRLLGVPIPTRVATDDIGSDLFAMSARNGWRTFLFGSAPGVADEAASTLRESFPQLHIVGTLHGWWDERAGHPGFFDAMDEQVIASKIRAAKPDVLWVGLPTPLQQAWVWRWGRELGIPLIITGGSYLDHVAERLDWYPRWILRARLCWLYRLWREPRRLWRRYTLEIMRFGCSLTAARWRAGRFTGARSRRDSLES